MDQPFPGLPPEDGEPFNLGLALGLNQAFGVVAGRCSAAQAAAFCRIRDEKLYKHIKPELRFLLGLLAQLLSQLRNFLRHPWLLSPFPASPFLRLPESP